MGPWRAGEEANAWLDRAAADSASELSAEDLAQLRAAYGDRAVDLVEESLRSTYATDWAGATDDQVVAVVKRLVEPGPGPDALEPAEEHESADAFELPPDEQLVAVVVNGIMGDPDFLAGLGAEFLAALDTHLTDAGEVPSDVIDLWVDQLVESTKAGLWQALEDVIVEYGDNVPDEARLAAALSELGLADLRHSGSVNR